MLTVYQFAPALGLPNGSPFCMKLEVWLRLAGLPYRLDNRGLVLKAPKRKLPFVDDDGTRVADSSAIIEHLARKHGTTLDAGLSAEQLAVATAFQRLFEENLYWAVVHTRWADPSGWSVTRQAFFSAMPAPLKWVLPRLARRGVLAQMLGHGMGRHSVAEIHAIGCRDITAVADFLADKPYMLGEQARSVDAIAYAFLANLLWVPIDSPIQRHAASRPTLDAYCRRMKERCGI